jgi:hypothetical protein
MRHFVEGIHAVNGPCHQGSLPGDVPYAPPPNQGQKRPIGGAPIRQLGVYPSRVAVIRTVSKFMTNEPP